ncbi:hypothetical protein ES704_02793 [subsurface metagenome]|jgi:hypothetical protein
MTTQLDQATLDILNARDKERDSKLSEKVKADIAESFAKAETSIEKKEEVEQKQLGGLAEVEIMGIPLGQAAIGGGVALLISELVDGIIGGAVTDRLGETWGPALIKGGSAWAIKQWGAGVIGAKAADTAALFLAWEAIRSLVPIDEWIKDLFKKKEEEEESESKGSSSSSHSSESSTGGNGHQTPDAMTTLRTSLAIGGSR